MIQRIQSIYLLLVVLLSTGVPFTFKIWEVADKEVYALDLLYDQSFFAKLAPIFFIISALIAFIAIFKFNKRQLQFVLGRIIILINLFLLGILIYLSLNISGEVSS